MWGTVFSELFVLERSQALPQWRHRLLVHERSHALPKWRHSLPAMFFIFFTRGI